MYTRTRNILLIISIFFLSGNTFSQPYYFSPKFFTDRSDTSYDVLYSGADIYRVDLTTGEIKLFLYNIPKYTGIIEDPTGQWVYINYYGDSGLRIVNINDTTKFFDAVSSDEYAGEIDGYAGVIYLPLKNRFYVTWLIPDTITGSGDISKTTIYDATTFKKIGDIDFGFSFADMVSPDNEYIYQYAADSSGNEVLYKFSTITNTVVSSTPFPNAGPTTENKAIVAGNMSKFVFEWQPSGISSILENYYSAYDVITEKNLPSILFPWKANAYLSADGNYITLNMWNWINVDTSAGTGEQFFPGTVYIFDASTGQLTQRLTLPSGGKILTFDSYPHNFYYYNDSTHQAITISDTTTMTVESLLDMLITSKEQAAAKGWIDNQGIANSLDSKLDNAKKRLAAGDTTAAKNILNAFVNEVEAQNGKHLTSEAYTLLKYNAEYLIERLPEKK